MRALVVDDSKAIRRIIGKILKDLGFEVFEAGDGKQALTKLGETGVPDLALVDWNMPEMNGYEFLCNIRADPKYNGLNVMMVTTESEISQMAKALEAGANEYLMKPFTKEMIAEKLEILGLTD
ncbi:MAG: response regulator [Myxococcota bacterium]|nr:response regulator [Myxococcota bacterium]